MDKNYEKQFGNKIRELREKSNLTQEQLAARLQVEGCNITRSAVAKIEVGQRRVYPDEIRLIRKILNAEYNEMFE